MAGVIRHLAAGMVAIGLTMAVAPATAQQSPAQVKAQREREAREAAARAQAQRERAAAAAGAAANARTKAAATARQQAARAEAERQARARQKAILLVARQQALREGKLNASFMVGRWAHNAPSDCKVEDGYSGSIYFGDDGEWGAYEDGGKWTVRDGDLIFSRAKYDGDGDGYDGDKLLGYMDEVNKVVTLADNLLVVEVNGGNDAWFRCESTPASVSNPKSRFAEPKYEYYDDAWRRANDIGEVWAEGKFASAFQMITAYLQAFPKLTYGTSTLLNYAGLYHWKNVGDRGLAAAWFLRNYQTDPSGTRAADSLLSLAQVMHEMGDAARYCIAMKQFMADYPFEAQYRLKLRYSDLAKLAACN